MPKGREFHMGCEVATEGMFTCEKERKVRWFGKTKCRH